MLFRLLSCMTVVGGACLHMGPNDSLEQLKGFWGLYLVSIQQCRSGLRFCSSGSGEGRRSQVRLLQHQCSRFVDERAQIFWFQREDRTVGLETKLPPGRFVLGRCVCPSCWPVGRHVDNGPEAWKTCEAGSPAKRNVC